MKIKFAFLLLITHCSLLIVKADWVQVNNGLTNLNVNALTSYTSGSVNYIFAGTLEFPSSLFVSTNNGNSWAVSWQIPNVVWALAATSGGGLNYVFAGTGNGMGYTTNNGANWYSAGLPHWIYSTAASGNYVFAGCKWQTFDPGGVYRSTNNGTNWIQTSLPTPQFGDYNALTINGNNVYAGGYPGTFISTDNGNNWVQSINGIQAHAFVVNGSYIFAGGGGGVFISTNNGMNWTQTSLTGVSINALAVYTGVIFAAGGFWLSTNNGSSWIQRNEGMPYFVKDLCISNGFIFAGTDGHGVYRRPLSELLGVKPISNEIPKNFELYHNYPNPFNSTTSIPFQISRRGNVLIDIYDVTGMKITVIINENLNAGKYEVTFDANHISSGIYYYRLIVNGLLIDTKKLVLIK